jgi:hypothetical protein
MFRFGTSLFVCRHERHCSGRGKVARPTKESKGKAECNAVPLHIVPI